MTPVSRFFSKLRPRLDANDRAVLPPLLALASIAGGAALYSPPAGLIVLGVGYLALGLYRRWF